MLAGNHPQSNNFMHFSNQKSAPLFAFLLTIERFWLAVSYRNRTYNLVLGGPCYIHLTNETNAAFPWKHSVFRIFVMATFILIISSFEAVNYNYFTFLIFVNTSSIITVSSVCYNRFSYFSEIILLPLFFPWFLFLLVLR